MTASRFTLVLSIAAAALLASATVPAVAGTDIFFGSAVHPGDPADVFYAISAVYFDRSRPTVEAWGHTFDNSDDLSVFLFLVQQTGKSPDLIASLRKDGNSWFDVGVLIGMPVDTWFVPVSRDPGPPYGNAYGHWKKSKKRGKPAFVLSDIDTRNLVAIRMIHEYYGVPVERAMELRAAGNDLQTLLFSEYDARYGSGMTGSVPKLRSNRHHQ